MATLLVGQGQQFATISAAVAASRDGDVVQVQAGTYTNDFAIINTRITLQAEGGMVHMVATGGIPNDKGILVTNADVTIDGFEFSGATGSSGNAAGIRYQAGHLTVTNSYFHDNQNGLLANPSASGSITIRNSEFAKNGAGDGYTHNLYAGAVGKLTIENSYFHEANGGHEIKSRALETEVTGTRIYDLAGSSAYSVDLPNGGRAVLSRNIIEQGPDGGNSRIVAFGAEGNLHAGSAIQMTDNTVINDLGTGALLWNAGGSSATISGARVWGLTDGQMVVGSAATVTNTTFLTGAPALDTSSPWTNTPGLTGTAADDVLMGGAGADLIHGGDGSNYLRGGDGNDQISGGAGFDDAHGNMGDDTVRGGGGDDWVVGGKDRDLLFGDHGSDIVLGNLGEDTLDGGSGADVIRGGQADDLLSGGLGNDWLSGDLGSDTITGGEGADIFNVFGTAGVDRVTDFDMASGDRVMVEPGWAYTVAQVGADVVVSLDGGAQLTLVNVSLGQLGSGWMI